MRESFAGAWLWVALFGCLAAVVFSMAFAWSRMRQRGRPAYVPPLPMTCPNCRRAFPMGTQFCPVDASRLLPNLGVGGQARAPYAGGKCPRCRRAFEAGMRFCPMDAEELVPLHQWRSEGGLAGGRTGESSGVQVEAFADHLIAGTGKICPICAAKYDLEAGYCGRDASELVPIN
jgi:predicted amidophosphoribosyltransferase